MAGEAQGATNFSVLQSITVGVPVTSTSAIWLRGRPSTEVKLPPTARVRPSGVRSMVQAYDPVPCRPTVASTVNVGSTAPVVASSRPSPECAAPLSQLKAPAT